MEIKVHDYSVEETIRKELENSYEGKYQRLISKLFGAALGSIPWIGGYISAITDYKSDEKQIRNNQLYEEWLKEHSLKMQNLSKSLIYVMQKFEEFPEDIGERLESEDFLNLVRKSFKCWVNADTEEKRELIRKLLVNAGTTKLVADDLIRLFIDWINTYHEIHFSVIRVIYQNPGYTRYDIWNQMNGQYVAENSMEADLFKLLIRDLSTGSVIRQHRKTDYHGNFVKSTNTQRSKSTKTLKSAFDDQEGYELTELGKQFVHYLMNEVVTRIE